MKQLLTAIFILIAVATYSQTYKLYPGKYSNGQGGHYDSVYGLVFRNGLTFLPHSSPTEKDTVAGSAATGTVTGVGSAQKLAIWNSASSLTYSNIFFDTTKSWLGINTTAPTGVLSIYPSAYYKTGTAAVTSGSPTVTFSTADPRNLFVIGQYILINGESRQISALTSTTATTNTNFTNTFTGVYSNNTLTNGIQRVDDNGNIHWNGSKVFTIGDSLLSNVGGNSTSLGYSALRAENSLTVGTTSVGAYSGFKQNSSGALGNSYFGFEAGYNNVAGASNTYIGYKAGDSANNNSNTAVGYLALLNAKSNSNVAVGSQALKAATTGGGIAIGASALLNMTTGGGIAIGTNALNTTTGSSNNTAIGGNVLFSTTSGSSNFAAGYQSMYYNTTGGNNIALGEASLQNSTTGSGNTAIGHYARFSATNASFNTSIGYFSDYYNTTATGTTSVGDSTNFGNISGNSNTSLGSGALKYNVGDASTAIGYQALAKQSLVVSTIAVTNGGSGYGSSPTIAFSGSGAFVTAGATANLTGGVVTSITVTNGGERYTSTPTITFSGGGGGSGAAGTVTMAAGASQNTAIGYYAGNSLSTGTNNIYIGNNVQPVSNTESNMMYIGNSTNIGLGIATTQTTVNGSTSGTAIFSEPLIGANWKKILIKFTALVGTATYTFPVAFANTPSVFGSDDVATSIVTSKSTTSVTVTGATTTGFLILEGY